MATRSKKETPVERSKRLGIEQQAERLARRLANEARRREQQKENTDDV